MVFFEGATIPVTGATLLQTPPNYSFKITNLYIGDSSTVLADANDQLSLMAYTTTSGTVTGTVVIGLFNQVPGGQSYQGDGIQELVPAGAYLVGMSVYGDIRLTYGGTYIYYRE